MANPIKYNESSENKALKVNNFWFGTGDVDKGPTSSTGFYNGITPPSGGYTIYLNKASQGPSIYVASNDAQLIDLTNKIANTNYTGVTECLNYFRGQSDKALFNREYGNVVTDGLILHLDAGFVGSYPQSGTTWYDLTGNGNNATLSDTTFSSDGGGSIVFTKSINYGVVNNNELARIGTGNHTIIVWVKNNQTINEDIIGTGTNNGDVLLMIFDNNGFETGRFRGHVWSNNGSANTIDSPRSIGTGNWNMLVQRVTWGGNIDLFENGVLTATQALSGSAATSSNTEFTIGNRTVDINPNSGPGHFDGKLPIVQVYNRALTNAEILQNYNAIKGRFEPSIVTNGLTFHMDASNPLSYPGSGSTIYDISGNNKNQTFYGGASWQSGNGGYIQLQNGGYTQGPQPDLNITNMTFSSWMFTNNIFNSGGNFLFSFQDNPNWYFAVTSELGNQAGKATLYSTKWTESNTTLSNGTWYFVTATFEPGTTKIYINGVLDRTDTSVGSSSAYSTPEGPPGNDLYIGNRYNTYYMDGGVAQSMMYNRTLSDSEILQNYNATKSRFGL